MHEDSAYPDLTLGMCLESEFRNNSLHTRVRNTIIEKRDAHKIVNATLERIISKTNLEDRECEIIPSVQRTSQNSTTQ